MSRAIIAVNAGSSSVKLTRFRIDPEGKISIVLSGAVKQIGVAPHLEIKDTAGKVLFARKWDRPDQPDAEMIDAALGWFEDHLGGDELVAVGHRVVHGGPSHHLPELVTPELLAEIESYTSIAPLHIPRNLAPIREIAASRPDLPQVVCFDTAFHWTMPEEARRYAIPEKYVAAGVRRYGFHGLSYEYISGRLREIAPDLVKGRVIVAHLGNGASLCALQGGQSIDTTMGFSALDGLVMGTRSGAIGPGVVLYLQNHFGLTLDEARSVLYHDSGLLALSEGLSSDMRVLLDSDTEPARRAVRQFVYQAARQAGAMIASLHGLDGLVFTAGIGEHAPRVRAMIAAELDWLGAKIDPEANARDAAIISTPDSRIEIRVIPTNEDLMIVRHCLDVLAAKG